MKRKIVTDEDLKILASIKSKERMQAFRKHHKDKQIIQTDTDSDWELLINYKIQKEIPAPSVLDPRDSYVPPKTKHLQQFKRQIFN